MEQYCCYLFSPLGKLKLTQCGETLVGIQVVSESEPEKEQATPLLTEACRQLKEYFAGYRKVFTLPLCPKGTTFQQKVWQALGQIPYGQTVTYGELAAKLGQPGAARAVGGACGANPLLVVIPCHRVCAARRRLGGFALGPALKEKLLTLEQLSL